MLNILARVIRSSLPQRLQHYASFTLRDILQERSESSTQLIRFAKHIALEGRREAPIVPTKIKYSDYFPVTNLKYFEQQLRDTAADQLPALLTFAFTYRPSADPSKFVMVLNQIDASALRLLPEMDRNTVLHILYSLIFLMPNWITRMEFYHAAMRQLTSQISDCTKDTFVQLCFYLGLGKKQKNSLTLQSQLDKLLQQQLEQHLPQMNSMDLALVCNASYKTSTLVHSAAYTQRLEEEVLALPLDSVLNGLLSTFIKAMRYQRIRSERVCEHLTNICSNISTLSAVQTSVLVHIFAYFADNLWDNQDSIAPFVTAFMQRVGRRESFQIQEDHIRAKDFAIFLWSCAQLNCKLSSTDMQRIETVVLDKVRNDEFRLFPDQLVDCSLSLWTLGHQSRQLLEEAVNCKTEARPKIKEQPKVESRLLVLLTAARIEQPTWTSQMPVSTLGYKLIAAPQYILNHRDDLKNYAKQCMTEEGVLDAKIVCPISSINIPGLIVKFDESIAAKNEIFVELLTNEQILRFSKNPVSIERLKVRLLEVLGHKVIILQPDDLKQENYGCLKDIVFGTDARETASSI